MDWVLSLVMATGIHLTQDNAGQFNSYADCEAFKNIIVAPIVQRSKPKNMKVWLRCGKIPKLTVTTYVEKI